jgi:septation ring formation regulator EzrA
VSNFRDILPGYPADNSGGTVAQRVVLSDDLDGSEATQTLQYMIDGQEYEIDLSEENVQRFHEALEPFVSASRQVQRQAALTRRRGDGRRRSGSRWRDDIPQIRAWAEANDYEVSARGRIKKEILDAYDEAHK